MRQYYEDVFTKNCVFVMNYCVLLLYHLKNEMYIAKTKDLHCKN